MFKSIDLVAYINKRIYKALELCELNDNELTSEMQMKLEFNLQIIGAYIELNTDRTTDLKTARAIGFFDDDDAEEDGEDE